ncbi:MAG: hypothetical protein IT441_06455 [Phycisphaeraceae bacterium]|nr:hypothetical protein [Phycisphaeraceae bacterium]
MEQRSASGLADIRSITTDGRRGVLVNGRPFVPTFAWWVDQKHLDALAASGVNTSLSPRADVTYAETARRLGIYVGANPRKDLANHDRVAMWMQEDEPDIRIEGGPRLEMTPEGDPRKVTTDIAAETLIDRAMPSLRERERICRAMGDGKPIFLNFSYLLMDRYWGPTSVSRPLYAAMSQTGDILSWDIYPIAAGGRVDWLPLIWLGTDVLRQAAPDKPVFVFLECVRISKHRKARDPNETEMRNEVWQAVAAGASGIGWFTFGPEGEQDFATRSFQVPPQNQAAMRRINDELTGHAALVHAPELCRGVRMGTDGTPEVCVSLRRDKKHVYFIAVNPRLDRQAIDWGGGLTLMPSADQAAIDKALGKLKSSVFEPLDGLEVRIVRV